MRGVWWWSSSTICPSAPSTTSRRVRKHPIETQPLGEVRQTRSGRQAFRSGRDRCTSVPTATHPILRLSISVRSDLHRMARSPRRTNGSCAGVRMLLTTRRGSRRDRDPSREALLRAEKGGRPVRPAVLLKANQLAPAVHPPCDGHGRLVVSRNARRERRRFRLSPRLNATVSAVDERYPAFAFSPAASIPAIAQLSSLSDVSPLTPTAPSNAPPSMISTPPGTGTMRPCASVFTASTK